MEVICMDGMCPISEAAFEVVLQYIYCGIDCTDVSEENAFEVFVGARYFELDCLCAACEVSE